MIIISLEFNWVDACKGCGLVCFEKIVTLIKDGSFLPVMS